MLFTQFFDYTNYFSINRVMIKHLGLVEAMMFSVLCSEYNKHYMNGTLHYDMFAISIEELKDITGLSYHKQITAIKTLEDANLIETVIDGMPAKKYYKIQQNQVLEFFKNCKDIDFLSFSENQSTTNSEKSSFQKIQNQPLYNNIYNNISSNNGNNRENMSIHVSEENHTNDVLENLKKELNMQTVTEENKKRAKDNGFLNSANTVQKEDSKDRYSQCVRVTHAVVNELISHIDNIERKRMKKDELEALLKQYLDMLFENKTKPVYVNMWRGILTKLKTLTEQGNNTADVIKQSIERGYRSFYPINQSFRANNNYKPNEQDLIDDIARMSNANDDEQEITNKIY